MKVDGIGVDGAKEMSEVLQVNTTLKSLDLSCEEENMLEKEEGNDY